LPTKGLLALVFAQKFSDLVNRIGRRIGRFARSGIWIARSLRFWLATIAATVFMIAFLTVCFYESWLRLSPHLAPWGTPDLTDTPGWFARAQLNSLSVDGNACVQTLARAQVHHTRLANRHLGYACGYTDVVSASPQIPFRPSLTATCSLTAGLVWYERELDDIARRVLGAQIVRIDHVGTYVCRNINWERDGWRSEHATANAIDVTAFRLSDGHTVSIARDWGKATAAGRFLHEAHDKACELFDVVLGPDYNKAHRTHFHLDLGRFRACH
jgi:hypothetical protein